MPIDPGARAHPEDTFDQFAADYDSALDRGLSMTGEGRDFFARARVAHLFRRVSARKRDKPVTRIMDFGCGTGSTVPLLASTFGTSDIVGVDTSSQSLEVARSSTQPQGARFALVSSLAPDSSFDLIYTNGVFHHIVPRERLDALEFVRRSLTPDGFFAFFENNPWNPGTRYVMSRIPFDQEAVTVSPRQACGLLHDAGFEVVLVDFLFFFPRWLSWLRVVEKWLRSIPLGAQYLVLCRLIRR